MKHSLFLLKTLFLFLTGFLVFALAFAGSGSETQAGIAGGMVFQYLHCVRIPFGVLGFLTLKEAKEKRVQLIEKMQSLFDKAKEEKRGLTEEEQTQWDALKKEVDDMVPVIRRLEDQESLNAELARRQGKPIVPGDHKDNNADSEKDKKDFSKYSLLRAIRIARGIEKSDGIEREMHEEGVSEAARAGAPIQGEGIIIPSKILSYRSGAHQRDVTATGGTGGNQGGVAVATDLGNFIDFLYNKLVMRQLGADFLTGLVGNVDMPKEATVAAGTWEGETDENAESSPTFSKLTLTPKRVGTFIDVSNQLLRQTSPSIEARLVRQLVQAVLLAIDSAAISGSGTDPVPEGILSTAGIGSVVAGDPDGAALDWADIVNLEKEVDVDNALMGQLSYLTNAKVKAALKTTKLDTGSGLFVWGQNSNELNGHPAVTTNLVPGNLTKGAGTNLSAVIFGNFNDVVIGQWGGIEVMPNPYTKAKSAITELIINVFADVLVTRPQSFAACVDAVA